MSAKVTQNPKAHDPMDVAPDSEMPEWLARRFHIEINHQPDRETVILR